MEEIIHRIIAADLSAQEKLRVAEETARQVIKQANLDKGRVEEEVWDTAKQFVASEKEKLEKLLFMANEEQKRLYESSLVLLENNFAKQRETWRNELFNHCLNQE